MDEILACTPLRRVAEPRETAGPVLFLACDLATYVIGQTLFVDGGCDRRLGGAPDGSQIPLRLPVRPDGGDGI